MNVAGTLQVSYLEQLRRLEWQWTPTTDHGHLRKHVDIEETELQGIREHILSSWHEVNGRAEADDCRGAQVQLAATGRDLRHRLLPAGFRLEDLAAEDALIKVILEPDNLPVELFHAGRVPFGVRYRLVHSKASLETLQCTARRAESDPRGCIVVRGTSGIDEGDRITARHCETILERLRDIYGPTCVACVGFENASIARVSDLLSNPDTACFYYFGHGSRPDEGGLHLHDGVLRPTALCQRLVDTAPMGGAFAFINSCWSAAGIGVKTPDLIRVLLESGWTTVIGTVLPPLKGCAQSFAESFFGDLLRYRFDLLTTFHRSSLRSWERWSVEGGESSLAWASYRLYALPATGYLRTKVTDASGHLLVQGVPVANIETIRLAPEELGRVVDLGNECSADRLADAIVLDPSLDSVAQKVLEVAVREPTITMKEKEWLVHLISSAAAIGERGTPVATDDPMIGASDRSGPLVETTVNDFVKALRLIRLQPAAMDVVPVEFLRFVEIESASILLKAYRAQFLGRPLDLEALECNTTLTLVSDELQGCLRRSESVRRFLELAGEHEHWRNRSGRATRKIGVEDLFAAAIAECLVEPGRPDAARDSWAGARHFRQRASVADLETQALQMLYLGATRYEQAERISRFWKKLVGWRRPEETHVVARHVLIEIVERESELSRQLAEAGAHLTWVRRRLKERVDRGGRLLRMPTVSRMGVEVGASDFSLSASARDWWEDEITAVAAFLAEGTVVVAVPWRPVAELDPLADAFAVELVRRLGPASWPENRTWFHVDAKQRKVMDMLWEARSEGAFVLSALETGRHLPEIAREANKLQVPAVVLVQSPGLRMSDTTTLELSPPDDSVLGELLARWWELQGHGLTPEAVDALVAAVAEFAAPERWDEARKILSTARILLRSTMGLDTDDIRKAARYLRARRSGLLL